MVLSELITRGTSAMKWLSTFTNGSPSPLLICILRVRNFALCKSVDGNRWHFSREHEQQPSLVWDADLDISICHRWAAKPWSAWQKKRHNLAVLRWNFNVWEWMCFGGEFQPAYVIAVENVLVQRTITILAHIYLELLCSRAGFFVLGAYFLSGQKIKLQKITICYMVKKWKTIFPL